MPLGAEPLAETDIAALEAWIRGGALRAPGQPQAPTLNNPPRRPEIAIFDASGARLDGSGPIQVAPGTTLVIRHSVQDFETPDASIPFAAIILGVGDGRNIVLEPTASDPHVGRTTFDPDGPMSRGDRLDYMRSWTIPPMLTLYEPRTKTRTDVSAHVQTVSIFAAYLDGSSTTVTAFDVSPTQIHIQ
jgi:hypothetical protein